MRLAAAVLGLMLTATASRWSHAEEPPEEFTPLEPLPKEAAAPPVDVPETERGRVNVGALAATRLRFAEGDGSSYDAAFEVGGFARFEALWWLAVRPFFAVSNHPVDAGPRRLGLCAGVGEERCAATSLEVPRLNVWRLGLRLEPQLRLTPRLRVWGGPSLVWGRATMRDVESTPLGPDGVDLDTGFRSGVHMEWALAAGVLYDVLPRWLSVGLSLEAGIFGQESGTLYEPIQAFDQLGQRFPLEPMAKFGSTVAGALTLSVPL